MKFVFTSFLAWKIWTIVFVIFSIYFVPHRVDFLGGGLEHYSRFPWFWAWGNFDGEHYLSIARQGYGNGEQAFFPLYSLLIRFLSWFRQGDIYAAQFSGLMISNAAFLLGLLGLWKLIKMDFNETTAKISVMLLLVFPTSFYFGSVYTEGLFFALSVWAFYFARRKNWWIAGALGAFATATRFIGIILLPALVAERLWGSKGKRFIWSWLGLAFIPLGLFCYMFYLNQTTGDFLAFFHSLSGFGEQRSTNVVPLPQVFWRYIKIINDIPKNDLLFFAVIVELVTAILFLAASILSFLKLRISYAVYLALGYLIPTFLGSFSSLPRYVLVLFPAFVLFAVILEKRSIFIKLVAIVLSVLLLGITTTMFTRGYWIS